MADIQITRKSSIVWLNYDHTGKDFILTRKNADGTTTEMVLHNINSEAKSLQQKDKQ